MAAIDPCRNCVLLLVAGASVEVALGNDDVVDVGRVMVENVEELTVFVMVLELINDEVMEDEEVSVVHEVN